MLCADVITSILFTFYLRTPYIFNLIFESFELELSEVMFELKLSDCTYFRL